MPSWIVGGKAADENRKAGGVETSRPIRYDDEYQTVKQKVYTMTKPTTTPQRKWRRPPRGGTRITHVAHTGPLVLTPMLECFYCGGQVTYAQATFDHIMPRSRIPHIDLADAAHNLVVACSPCNMSKGTRTFDEWFSVLIERYISNTQSAKNQERECNIIARSQAIEAMIEYRGIDYLDPNYVNPYPYNADAFDPTETPE